MRSRSVGTQASETMYAECRVSVSLELVDGTLSEQFVVEDDSQSSRINIRGPVFADFLCVFAVYVINILLCCGPPLIYHAQPIGQKTQDTLEMIRQTPMVTPPGIYGPHRMGKNEPGSWELDSWIPFHSCRVLWC